MTAELFEATEDGRLWGVKVFALQQIEIQGQPHGYIDEAGPPQDPHGAHAVRVVCGVYRLTRGGSGSFVTGKPVVVIGESLGDSTCVANVGTNVAAKGAITAGALDPKFQSEFLL